ncbi:ABC transporter permease subunit [Allosaccharopolyspora coralli]|uniref:ABC transporter permease subunit n=1 Tax=Allosaccharopolyspora coralli TaxID=2665642 RepID=A0A5Q3Q159_9PSEU|nr:ABC transporter permease [Allosaccharopolyspora coralli]QGK68222.1 ABC transporter permease subunit [Allosaccharopolyspora coralli]
MTFADYVADRWQQLLVDSYQHVSMVVQCVVLATVVGVLVGVAVYRSPAGSSVATALSSAVLTVPSYALFGLLIPLLGLGVAPSVVTLVLYALLPIVRNTIVGLSTVDQPVVDAARGIGMSRWSVLRRVELRLAWPAILTGMRVSTQMLMGIAAIAAYAKGPGLGNLIFSGLSGLGGANAVNMALAGTLGVIILALVLDALFVLVGRWSTSRGIRG